LKITVVYASVGAGHRKAAEAIYSCLKEYYSGIDVKLADILESSAFFFRFFYRGGYDFLVRRTHLLWSVVYWLAYFRVSGPLIRAVVSVINRLCTLRFSSSLINDGPDVVVSTHFLSSEICAGLRSSGKINSRIISVVTDFEPHPFWISEGTGSYVVATQEAAGPLLERGVEPKSIKPLGIPIDPKFSADYKKDELQARFNLDKNRFTVLVMTGSFGIGPIETIVDVLCGDFQVLVVCANNNILFERLKEKNYPRVKVFGFIDTVNELMAVSDIIVTKPGGLTISELLSMDLAPIFISAIPGQEAENAEALRKLKIGITAKDAHEVRDRVVFYREHPEALEEVRGNIARIKRPLAAREICDAICKGSI